MFNHYTFIPPEHHVALEASVRNHSLTCQPPMLAALYRAALANLEDKEIERNPKTKDAMLSMLRDPHFTVSTATDAKAGVYVQLSRLKDHPAGKVPLLTVGQKWVAENPTAAGTSPTKIW